MTELAQDNIEKLVVDFAKDTGKIIGITSTALIIIVLLFGYPATGINAAGMYAIGLGAIVTELLIFRLYVRDLL